MDLLLPKPTGPRRQRNRAITAEASEVKKEAIYLLPNGKSIGLAVYARPCADLGAGGFEKFLLVRALLPRIERSDPQQSLRMGSPARTRPPTREHRNACAVRRR